MTALAVPASAVLIASAQHVFEHVVAGRTFQLDCTYAQTGAEGLAVPPYDGSPGQVYVRPWICAAINRAVRQRWQHVDRDGTVAMATLVLTHESVHLSSFAGARDEHLTECRALALMPAVLAALGAPAAMIPRLVDWARQAHNLLLDRFPRTYGPECA